MSGALPTIVFGHGSPMNAVLTNSYTEAWRGIGADIPQTGGHSGDLRPLVHAGTAVTVNAVPRTIHDFGGFPRELYEVQYPAADAPELARRVQALLAPLPVKLDSSWGLDHGTWSVFRHVYPDADIPIVQLSIDERQSATAHFEIGRKLAALRVEGILIAGSGNLVHNLHTYAWDGTCLHPTIGQPVLKKIAKNLIISGEYRRLIEYESLGRDAMLSIPTPDHYLPLLYVIGARQDGEAVKFPIEGVDGGSISMLAVQIG